MTGALSWRPWFAIWAGPRRALAWAVVLAAAASGAVALALPTTRAPGAPSAAPASQPSHESAARTLLSLPAPAGAAVSRGLGADLPSYTVHSVKGSPVALGAGLRSVFSRGHVSVSAAGDAAPQLQLGLSAIGRDGRLSALAATAPAVHANRVDFAHAGVSEWYANGPLGLEQGFSLATRPAGSGPLSLVVGHVPALSRASLSGDWLTVGTLRYGAVSVTDARGRSVPAWLTLAHGGVLLHIADGHASYPLLIDPMVESAELTASDGQTDLLGAAVAASSNGTTVAVGGPGFDTDAGAVYVFTEPPSGWQNATQTAQLTASDGGGFLGVSVAISANGATIVAGASMHDQAGAAYVFSQPASGVWQNATQTAELTATDSGSSDQFGRSVAISSSGSTIAVGAPEHATTGAVYVFSESTTGVWQNATQSAELGASDAGGLLGYAVGISANGGLIAGGAPAAASNAGAVYLFSQPASGVWQNAIQNAELTASGETAGGLGTSVGVSATGATIASGAPDQGNGAVYVFSQPASGVWQNASQNAELTASDATGGDLLGQSVAIASDGTSVAAGALGHSGGDGAVYLFTEPANGVWASATQAALTTGSSASSLGFSVAVAPTPSEVVAADASRTAGTGQAVLAAHDPTEIIAGAPGQNGSLGAAYVLLKATSTLATTVDDAASNAAWTGNEAPGASAYDTATFGGLEAGVTPTGTVTYAFYDNAGCTGSPATSQSVTVTTAGGVPNSPATGALAAGTYGFQATYSGDGNYQGASSSCEPFVIASPPSVSIATPASGATYNQGAAVDASYTCSEGANGPGLASSNGCVGTVANGSPINTSSSGTQTFTVTATSQDGQTTTQTVTYHVAGPPTVSITTPTAGASYTLNQTVDASYTCSEGTDGPGLLSGAAGCTGTVPDGFPINTASSGSHTFTVTATSSDGQQTAKTITYSVRSVVPSPPTVTITTPAAGATYNQGQVVDANYTCSDGANGPGLLSGSAGCTGTVADGSPINTASTGPHTFTVTATSQDGQHTTKSVTYTVVAVPKLADLKVTISGPQSASEGSTFSDTVTVSNAGPAAATGVITGLIVPFGLTVSSSGGGNELGSVVFWNASSIPDGGHEVYTVTFKVTSRAFGVVLIGVGTASTQVPDPNYSNNTAAIAVALGQSGHLKYDAKQSSKRLRNPLALGKRLPARLETLTHYKAKQKRSKKH